MMGNTTVVMNVGQKQGMQKRDPLTRIEDLPEDKAKEFCGMVDTIVMSLDEDPELKEAFKFLNDMALQKKITIYDMLLEVYETQELDDRLDDWRAKKS